MLLDVCQFCLFIHIKWFLMLDFIRRAQNSEILFTTVKYTSLNRINLVNKPWFYPGMSKN